MHPPVSGRLALPGAKLYYEVRGAGPALLIIPSGNGDATPFGPMADALAERYTVITYDRRGFSRSPVNGPVDDDLRIELDAYDAHRLLGHLAETPAHVFGSSSGAIVALALLERYPERVRTLVCHEPPLASVLPDSGRWLAFYADLYETYRGSGVEAARAVFLEAMGMNAPTRPPKEVELPPDQLAAMLARIRRNHVFWFEHEIRTYPAYLPDIPLLRTMSDRLVLGNGSIGHEHFPYRPNTVLSERIGLEIVHFPGGHVGYVTHPFEFAAELEGVLATREDRASVTDG
ncbi:alpha/beta fold hydrolase [Nonomuraea jiangxiensis]|uniref:Pimeloyl-ACP methyl ester carboxylesterase n=1 Tax=Nonomuraea jiangxiensis TaxID=633440 RepID=A0A1G8IDA8_9ACTN|nr:alpha/beta fold hydrolase [Nonomuraea jiangxiensis]SDI16969.1 Pimeloyl-ACP methyl ester carboxylesterase [Nonomuraea jiangxiensis]